MLAGSVYDNYPSVWVNEHCVFVTITVFLILNAGFRENRAMNSRHNLQLSLWSPIFPFVCLRFLRCPRDIGNRYPSTIYPFEGA